MAAAAPKNSSDAQPAWKRVSIGIDSVACDSVNWTEHVPDHEVHESDESWRGKNFQSATREPIPIWERSTVATVTKPFGSVKKICQAGHTVVFDDEESFI